MPKAQSVAEDRRPLSDPGVLLVTELFPPFVGGSAVLFENVYSRLDIRNVVVLADRGGREEADEVRGSVRILRRRLATPRWGVLHPAGLAHHLRIARTLRSLSTGQPTVLHCARALPEGLAAMLAAWSTGIRYVCWAHGEELAYARTSRELAWLTRQVFGRASAVIANSRHTAQLVQDAGTPQHKIEVVYPGVDMARFHPSIEAVRLRRRLVPNGEVLLLSVGRLQRRKGHDMLIRALASLDGHAPGLRYAIVGEGEERARLDALVRELGLGHRVIFEGEVDAGSLPGYYAACDVFVLPNRIDGVDVEGFGMVFLEAAAAGRPTIGGRSGGVPEAIAEGRTGLLVSGTDVAELAAAVSLLGQSDLLRRQMGAAGRARVLEKFSWERAASAVAAIHRTLAAAS